MKEKIAVIVGSQNDLEELKSGLELLKESNITYCLKVLSAHRHPEKLRDFCLTAQKQGIEVIIGCAGMAAALPGFIASYVDIPVIGVAMKGGLLDGMDALLSITSTPKGLGLVCSGVGKNAFINAIIAALAILALKEKRFKTVLDKIKKKFKQ